MCAIDRCYKLAAEVNVLDGGVGGYGKTLSVWIIYCQSLRPTYVVSYVPPLGLDSIYSVCNGPTRQSYPVPLSDSLLIGASETMQK